MATQSQWKNKMRAILFILAFLFIFNAQAEFTLEEPKKYIVYSYDDKRVILKRGKKKIKFKRSDIKQKKIKVNDPIWIHDSFVKDKQIKN